MHYAFSCFCVDQAFRKVVAEVEKSLLDCKILICSIWVLEKITPRLTSRVPFKQSYNRMTNCV